LLTCYLLKLLSHRELLWVLKLLDREYQFIHRKELP
jgi:hypothetical protein